ncbi:putative reverse transcriptase domain-containing protein, partial [Tanacetum coccineum]
FLGTSMECNELNVEGLFSKLIYATTSSNMVRAITNDEIKAAMFDIDDDKAPGPDGRIMHIPCSYPQWSSANQAAFVPGRRISDNILITQELMHSYHRNCGPLRCAFKVDIQKAYDTVDWRFLLETILVSIGLHCIWMKWIIACVTSTSFSLNINGNIHGFFKGKRGLRQGDPLSPYLFTMVMEILSLILKRRVRMSDSFRFHKHCEELEIINVCFADDLFIFARGDLASARVILESLDEFKWVPLISSRLLNKDCKILVEKAKNRTRDWKNKSLSFAGRLQLCKSVISSMHCNGEYKWVYKARLLGYFVRNDICLPKEEGGLGLRRHPFKDGMSWGRLKLLQLRDIVQPFFWVKLGLMVGNGDNIAHFQCFLLAKAWKRFLIDQGKKTLQRNNRVFKQVKKSPEDIRDIIMVTVRLKLLTFRFKDTSMVNQLLARWKMPKYFMTRSSTNKLFTPFQEPEREFRSSRRHFKTLSLDELRSPDFSLFSDQEEYSEEEVTETMVKTMEQYMSKTRTDYGSGVARPKIEDKDHFELKGQFLKELRENTFSGSNDEDANEHIEKVLEIVDLFHVPNITQDQLIL